jgi:hypothetical protein
LGAGRYLPRSKTLGFRRTSKVHTGASPSRQNAGMDPGTAAILGALAGAAGAIGVAILQVRAQKNTRAADAREELVRRRLDAYIALLVASRELRFVALRAFRGTQERSPSDIDAMRTNISKAYYLISLTAPRKITDAAKELRDAAIHLYRYSHDHPDADWDKVAYPMIKHVRETSDSFRELVRSELDIAP